MREEYAKKCPVDINKKTLIMNRKWLNKYWHCKYTWNIFLVFLNIKTCFQTICYLCYMILFHKRFIYLPIYNVQTYCQININLSSPLTVLPTLEIPLPTSISVWWLVTIFSHLITLYKVSKNENSKIFIVFSAILPPSPPLNPLFIPYFAINSQEKPKNFNLIISNTWMTKKLYPNVCRYIKKNLFQ